MQCIEGSARPLRRMYKQLYPPAMSSLEDGIHVRHSSNTVGRILLCPQRTRDKQEGTPVRAVRGDRLSQRMRALSYGAKESAKEPLDLHNRESAPDYV